MWPVSFIATEKAIRYARLAADEAGGRSAHRQVIELCQLALRALAHTPEARETLLQELEIRQRLRNAQLAAGDLDSIPPNLQRALTLAELLDDDGWRAWIITALAHYYWLARDLSRAFELCQRRTRYCRARLGRSALGDRSVRPGRGALGAG